MELHWKGSLGFGCPTLSGSAKFTHQETFIFTEGFLQRFPSGNLTTKDEIHVELQRGETAYIPALISNPPSKKAWYFPLACATLELIQGQTTCGTILRITTEREVNLGMLTT